MTHERSPSAVGEAVQRAEGFDPAASTGLFVGVSEFARGRIAAVPFAVDDAVDLAFRFACELGLVRPERAVLALAGEPKKPGSGEKLAALLGLGAQRVSAGFTDLYHHLGEQTRAAGREGLCLVTVASHGISDQGGDFVLAADSLADRLIRTGVSVAELFDEVAASPAPRRLVLLDACRERWSAETRGLAGTPMRESFAAAIGRASGQVVLSAAPLGGYAYDDVKRKNGVFTAAVLEGLAGKAAADDRGFITARTLGDFVQERVAEWVRRHRPKGVRPVMGIGRWIDGPAEGLPLAVDPERERSREEYRIRRVAALGALRAHLGGVLRGAHFDEISELLPTEEPPQWAAALLEEIEALEEGGVRAQRSLLHFVGELPKGISEKPAFAEPPTDLRGLVEKAIEAGRLAVQAPAIVRKREELGREKEGGAAEPAEPAAGDPWVGPLGMRFRFVPAGTYWIGSPEGEPGRSKDELRHQVRFTRGFWMGETPVTQGQWKKLLREGEANPSMAQQDPDDHPVVWVSWFEAVQFANRLSELEGLEVAYNIIGGGRLGVDFGGPAVAFLGLARTGYRLATEAEWEVAARAGTGTATHAGEFAIGDRLELEEIAWFKQNSGGTTSPVGRKRPNAWGVHDMLGNVWEWTGDWKDDYRWDAAPDPLGPSTGDRRVRRGGSFKTSAESVRAALRLSNGPDFRDASLGFRLARSQKGSGR